MATGRSALTVSARAHPLSGATYEVILFLLMVLPRLDRSISASSPPTIFRRPSDQTNPVLSCPTNQNTPPSPPKNYVHVTRHPKQAFLTHNGRLLGAAFPGIRGALDAAGLYPCVGLHGPGEAVRINFGQRPFLYDLGASVKGEDYQEQAAVAAVPVCPSLLRSLVRDYLLHQVGGGVGVGTGTDGACVRACF